MKQMVLVAIAVLAGCGDDSTPAPDAYPGTGLHALVDCDFGNVPKCESGCTQDIASEDIACTAKPNQYMAGGTTNRSFVVDGVRGYCVVKFATDTDTDLSDAVAVFVECE